MLNRILGREGVRDKTGSRRNEGRAGAKGSTGMWNETSKATMVSGKQEGEQKLIRDEGVLDTRRGVGGIPSQRCSVHPLGALSRSPFEGTNIYLHKFNSFSK